MWRTHETAGMSAFSARGGLKLDHVILLAGLLCAAFVWIPGTASDPERFAVPKEAVLHLSVLVAYCSWMERADAIEYDVIDALLFVFVLLGWLSASFIADNAWAAIRAAAISTSGALVFYIARRLALSARMMVAMAVIAIGAGIAMWVLLEAYGVIPVTSLRSRAPGGPLGNRSRVAHVLAIILPVALAFASTPRNRLRAVLTLGGTALMAAAIMITRSRAGWLAAGAASTIVLAIHFRVISDAPGRVIGWAAGALMMGCAFAVMLPPNLNWRSTNPYRDTFSHLLDVRSGSGHVRLRQNSTTLAMVKDNPILGVGPGNWQLMYGRYASPGDPSYDPKLPVPTNRLPHGDWLGILAERGAIAFSLMVVAGIVFLRRGWLAAKSGPKDGRLIAIGGLGALGAVLIVGVGDPLVLTGLGTYVVALSFATLLPASMPGRVTNNITRGLLVGAICSMSAVALVYSARQTWSAAILRNSPPSMLALTRAARIDPGDYLSRVQLAHLWRLHGRCDLALWYSREAADLFPIALAPAMIAAGCKRQWDETARPPRAARPIAAP